MKERARCQSCGTYPEEWIDEDGVPVYPPPWEVTSQECLGCSTLAEERKFIPAHVQGINLYLARPGTVQRKDRAELAEIQAQSIREGWEQDD